MAIFWMIRLGWQHYECWAACLCSLRCPLTLPWPVVQDPKEDKFRKIRVSNAAFQSRVASMSGALKFLELIGFHKEDDSLVMPAEKATTETLNAAGGELNNACTNPFFGVL